MKKLLCFIGGAMLTINLFAQQIKPLSIGDQVPDLSFKNVMNFPKQQFKLSDFKGKLVILDFFGTWCGACIPYIPKLDAYQKKLDDKVQVIVICEDVSNEIVTKYIKKKWNSVKDVIKLPFVLYDSSFMTLFPHRMVPHEVWISPEGKLMATTDAEQVTTENLIKAYSTPHLQLKQKVDQMDFDRESPLLVNGNGGSMDILIKKSLFTRKLEGVACCSGITHDTASHTKRLYCINSTLVNLLTVAYGISRNKFVLLKNNSIEFIDTMQNNQPKDSLYGYELTIPDTVSKSHYRAIVRKDIEQNFDIKTQLKMVEIPCYILKKLGNANESNSTGKNQYDNDLNFFHINVTPRILANIMSANGFPIVLNETNLTGNISINIPKDCYKQIELTKKLLAEKGLELIWAKRSVELVTIQDQNN